MGGWDTEVAARLAAAARGAARAEEATGVAATAAGLAAGSLCCRFRVAKVFLTWSVAGKSHTFADGNKVVHGQQGELVGPAPLARPTRARVWQ